MELRAEEYVSLTGLLPADLADGIEDRFWKVPSWAFHPDQWTFAFLRGLRKMGQVPGDVAWEVGVGTGLVSYMYRQRDPGADVSFSDFDPRCTELAVENLRNPNTSRLSTKFNPLSGSWDLVGSPKEKQPRVKTLVACIPQALLPRGADLANADNEAHYYDPAKYPESELHHLGLGLNEALLVRAKPLLLPEGRVVLNLGGRPGHKKLLQMFMHNGYWPTVLHEEVIPQHPGTCLKPFAELEQKTGEAFEFFADSEGEQQINAAEAERLRLEGGPVFHNIYVIEGKVAED